MYMVSQLNLTSRLQKWNQGKNFTLVTRCLLRGVGLREVRLNPQNVRLNQTSVNSENSEDLDLDSENLENIELDLDLDSENLKNIELDLDSENTENLDLDQDLDSEKLRKSRCRLI